MASSSTDIEVDLEAPPTDGTIAIFSVDVTIKDSELSETVILKVEIVGIVQPTSTSKLQYTVSKASGVIYCCGMRQITLFSR